GVLAAERALANAGVRKEEIDFIIFATLSPDHHFPGSGVYMQDKLGIPGVGALDVRNQCSGFLYSLAVADAFVRTGQYKRILVVGAENHSHCLEDPRNSRDVAVLFGDGAGAAVVGPSESEDRGIFSIHLHADGSGADALKMDVFDFSKLPFISEEDLRAGIQWPKMDGRKVFMNAVGRMKEVMQEALKSSGFGVEDIDMVIPHQANLRINETVRKSLGMPEEKFHNNLQKYGNTTAASIPLALTEAIELGKVKPGSLVAFVAFGAGFTWGAAVMRW
ncbi:MAG: beta-ketoacyl-ACP synthase 3, partial [Candidatus Methylomirabilis sp.]|nr:beta-ketoacyl-ACP synthase 3 [Deltaproteobacteria bacterium]